MTEMTQDEIIRMAREAGLVFGLQMYIDHYQLERFYQLAFAAGAANKREKLQTEDEKIQEAWETIRSVVETYRKERNNDLSKMV